MLESIIVYKTRHVRLERKTRERCLSIANDYDQLAKSKTTLNYTDVLNQHLFLCKFVDENCGNWWFSTEFFYKFIVCESKNGDFPGSRPVNITNKSGEINKIYYA